MSTLYYEGGVRSAAAGSETPDRVLEGSDRIAFVSPSWATSVWYSPKVRVRLRRVGDLAWERFDLDVYPSHLAGLLVLQGLALGALFPTDGSIQTLQEIIGGQFIFLRSMPLSVSDAPFVLRNVVLGKVKEPGARKASALFGALVEQLQRDPD